MTLQRSRRGERSAAERSAADKGTNCKGGARRISAAAWLWDGGVQEPWGLLVAPPLST